MNRAEWAASSQLALRWHPIAKRLQIWVRVGSTRPWSLVDGSLYNKLLHNIQQQTKQHQYQYQYQPQHHRRYPDDLKEIVGLLVYANLPKWRWVRALMAMSPAEEDGKQGALLVTELASSITRTHPPISSRNPPTPALKHPSIQASDGETLPLIYIK